MPVVVNAIYAAASYIYGAYEAAEAAGGIYAIVAQVVVAVVASVALQKIEQALAGKPAGAGDPTQRLTTARGTDQYQQLIYGQIRTGGFLAYMNTSGVNNDILWFVVVVAGHEVTEIDDLWLDSRHVANSDIGGGGLVTSAAFNHNGVPMLQINKYLGGSGSTISIDTILQAACPEWDTSHLGSGVGCVVFQLARDSVVWPSGAPSNFFALVKGRKLYDPRLDSTNGGSGSQRFTDASTWQWSQNWALAVRDYLSGGAVVYASGTPDKRKALGEADARIDDSYIIAAANHADESVTVPLPIIAGTTNWTNGSNAVTGNGTLFTALTVGWYIIAPNGVAYPIATITDDVDLTITVGGGYPGATVASEIVHFSPTNTTSTTESRFTADCQLSCGNTHSENIQVLLSGGNGKLTYASGKWALFAGVYTTPVTTLTQDDIVGAIDVVTHDTTDQAWNYVTGTFFDENNGWAQMPFPAQQAPTYEADDGRQYPRSIDLQATRGVYRAQRLGQVILQQGRNMITVNMTALSQRAFQIKEWENFFLTIPEYGWSNQVLKCISWKFLASGFVAIAARAEGSSGYTDLALGAYVDPSTNNPPKFVTDTPSAPLGLTTTDLPNQVGIVVTYPVYFPAGQTIEIWEYSSNAPFSSATKIAEGRQTSFAVPHFDAVTRYYWATVHDQNGGRSTNYPSGAGVGGFALQQVYTFGNNTAAPQWMHIGTVVVPGAQSASFYWSSGVGYNSNSNQQSIAEITLRAGNDGAAPNLSGINVINTGAGATISQIKAKATAGSTSATNHSWEIYALCAQFTLGPLDVVLDPNNGASFTFDGSASTDPGVASSSVVVGNVTAGLNPVAGSGLDALPDGTTFARALAAGLTSGVTNTTGLVANAATSLAFAVDDSTYTVTFAGSTLASLNAGYTLAIPFASNPVLTFTPTVSQEVILTLTTNVQMTNTNPTVNLSDCFVLMALVDTAGSLVDYSPKSGTAHAYSNVSMGIQPSPTPTQQWTGQMECAVTAGHTYSLYLLCQTSASQVSAKFTSTQMQAEIVKR